MSKGPWPKIAVVKFEGFSVPEGIEVDEVGLLNRDLIGMDQICFEVDYPHADSTFPHTKDVATSIVTKAGLNDEEIYKLMRGNAIRGWGLERFGITQ